MLTKPSILIIVVSLLLCLAVFAGCSENSNGTEVVTNTAANTSSSDNSSAIVDNAISIMKIDGFDSVSGKGVLSLGWRQLFDPRAQTTALEGRALAVGFDEGSSSTHKGIDMGSVYLNYSTNHLELQKHSGPQGGVAYGSFSGPRDNNSINTNIQFASNGSYEFEVNGSAKFSAIKTTITAPAALLSITAPAKDASVSTSNDLTITWQGGNTNGSVLIAIPAPPARPSGDGPPQGGGEHAGPGGMRPPGGPDGGKMGPPSGEDHPPMPDSSRAIIVRLDNNSGSYTVSAAALQALVKKTSAKELICMVSQLSAQEVDHDGGKIHVILQNGDGVRVTLQ